MLEYHGTCTILAINRIHESVQLKLLMGGIRECIQDNFPLGKADWINANIDKVISDELNHLSVGKQIKISAVGDQDTLELRQFSLI